jgi:hypothetical protein
MRLRAARGEEPRSRRGLRPIPTTASAARYRFLVTRTNAATVVRNAPTASASCAFHCHASSVCHQVPRCTSGERFSSQDSSHFRPTRRKANNTLKPVPAVNRRASTPPATAAPWLPVEAMYMSGPNVPRTSAMSRTRITGSLSRSSGCSGPRTRRRSTRSRKSRRGRWSGRTSPRRRRRSRRTSGHGVSLPPR